MSSVAARRPQPIGLLLVEDSQADSRLLAESLREVTTESTVIRTVRTLADAKAEMGRYAFNCVLLDLGLPDGQGVRNVEALRAIDRSVAIVVLTGTDDDRLAAEAIRLGAQEYLVKGQFDGAKILRILRHAVERNRQLYESEDERVREFHRASHDSLTGLANRDLLYDRVEQLIRQSGDSEENFALCYVDLDGFKGVNDRHGHRIGDDLLVRVAQVLQESVGIGDSVARVGGDEFMVVLRIAPGRPEPGTAARRIRERINAIRQLGDYIIELDASVGVVLYPQHGTTIAVLTDHADRAMYEAKREGGGVVFYDDALTLCGPERIAELREEITQALDRDQFSLLYQPWVDVAAGGFAGLEVLLRWEREGGGVHRPDEFLKAAAASGHSSDIGLHVAVKAFRQWRQWRETEAVPAPLALNLTDAELADERYLLALGTAAASSGIDAQQIRLEIPASALGGAIADRAHAQLRRAQAQGFGLVLDQFGPDGESLKWLSALPLSGVKLSRHVLQALHEEGMQGPMRRFVIAVIGAAERLGITVVASGVETVDERVSLQAMGCNLMQGMLFSAPEPVGRVLARMRQGPSGIEAPY